MKSRAGWRLGWLLGLLLLLPAAIDGARAEAPQDGRSAIDLDLYASLLERHTRPVSDVAGTRVDYAGLAASADWRRLLRQLEASRPGALDRDARIAFWINAYNILAIEIVLRSYPVESIKDIGSFFSPVWKKEILRIEERAISLDHVEHEVLRPMGDPRIHSAIVCASTSCPSLARRPFRSDALDIDLDASMRAWLASPEKGLAIDRARQKIALSKIFDWFEEDFAATGGVLAAILPHLDAEDAAWIRRYGDEAGIRYLGYDWRLNDLASQPR